MITRVRRYRGAAWLVLDFDPTEFPKRRFTVIACFGRKERAEKFAAQHRKGASK